MQALSFRNLRITLLLACLATAALVTLHQIVKTRSWTNTLDVLVLPINGDGLAQTEQYINSLTANDFREIDKWFEREARKFSLQLEKPVAARLTSAITSIPPTFPADNNPLSVMTWGLRFRWWAFRNTPDIDKSLVTVRLFVMYYQGDDNKPLQHSLGLQKGLLGLVHAYATPDHTSQNNIVIAHELLHTVGAIDKYVDWGAPVYPAGYAAPSQQPLFPQRNAEIMAGRIPVSHQKSYMPASLQSVVINGFTAQEINWYQ